MGYAKTLQGQEVVKTRSVALAPRLRTLLLLCDGHRSEAELLASVAGCAAADFGELLKLGLIAATAPAKAAEPPAAPSHAAEAAPHTAAPAADEASRYRAAYPIATQLVAGLGLRGFRLQLEVEKAMSLKELAALAPKLREALEKAHGAPQAKAMVAGFDKALRGG